MSSRKLHSRPFGVERLERRLPLAGNVKVAYDGTGATRDIVITGDSSANHIEIYQPTTLDQFVVKGFNNTRVNGVLNGSFRFDIVDDYTDDFRVSLYGGADRLVIRGANSDVGDFDAWDDLVISMGTGNDYLELRYVEVGGNLVVDTGTGADFFKTNYVRVYGDFTATNSTLVQSAQPKVRFDLYNTYVSDDLDIDLQHSIGVVNMRGVNVNDMFVTLRSGNDKLNIKSSRARSTHLLDGGSGIDSLNLFRNFTVFTGTDFKSPTRSDIWYT